MQDSEFFFWGGVNSKFGGGREKLHAGSLPCFPKEATIVSSGGNEVCKVCKVFLRKNGISMRNDAKSSQILHPH